MEDLSIWAAFETPDGWVVKFYNPKYVGIKLSHEN